MIRVHIEDRFHVNGLDLHIFERLDESHVQIWTPDGFSRTEIVYPNAHQPTFPFHMPREAAGPLWAALGKLLGSVENPEMLRKDYEAERRRVDRLIEAVVAQ